MSSVHLGTLGLAIDSTSEVLIMPRRFPFGQLGLVETARDPMKFRDGFESEVPILDGVVGGLGNWRLADCSRETRLESQDRQVEERKIATGQSRWRDHADEATGQCAQNS